MKFRVLHNPDFIRYREGDTISPDALLAVAEVETDSLERAYELTNSIDQPWWLNDGVTALVTSDRRSTSVGDVIVNLDNQSAHAVCMFGFKELEGCYENS